MNTNNTESTIAGSHKEVVKPFIYDYVDYKDYLRDIFDYRKKKNPAFSESSFLQSAGFGKNSRGYLGLILKGKRNVTANSILGFAQALKLNTQEAMYFESMIQFNQATSEDKKVLFFERMGITAKKFKGKRFEILEGQHRYISKWHLVILRELVNLSDFNENESWIVKKIRWPISRDDVRQGFKDLENLGLITRDATGKLVQSEPHISFTDNKHNFKNTLELHKHFANQVATMLEKDPYEKRAARLTTLACQRKDFEAIREEIKEFGASLIEKYDTKNSKAEVVLQLGMQLLSITE